MKVFLTGSTGYVGNRLMRALLDNGHEVHTIVRNPAKTHHVDLPGVKAFKGDLSDAAAIERAMEGCEQAYHTAALARLWSADIKPFMETNVVPLRDRAWAASSSPPAPPSSDPTGTSRSTKTTTAMTDSKTTMRRQSTWRKRSCAATRRSA
ncbi:MAG: NAD-dependent epimerase/dehydratase family protein [Chitinophagia bacterium]|nr:NAD-dependent epimerase/dehydratase family protein [Chitinophagia bacterium]